MSVWIAALVLAGPAGSDLKAKPIFSATEPELKKLVGRRLSPPKEPGIRFEHAGYYEVWVDSPGPGMKTLRLQLQSLIPWQPFLKQVGLDPSHAKAQAQPNVVTATPLFRNKLALSGVHGLPAGWNVTFVEYAVANVKRTRALRSQILAQPVGESRNALIRSCYDWWSELNFTKS